MKLALFDLDHTLLNGDSCKEWGNYLIHNGIVEEANYRAEHLVFCEDYHRGVMDIQALLKFQLEILTRHPKEQLHAWREEYVEQRIRPLILDAGRKAIERHKKEGDEIILITATSEFLTAPIAELLGIKHLIASNVERDAQGNYTGRSFGIPSYQEGKVRRLQEWCLDQGRSLEDYKDVWFYSDSHNDLPLLSKVNHPVAVNPDAKLLQHAREKNWPVVDFGVLGN